MARGEKTAEDQGVPWMKTRVCGGGVCWVWSDGEGEGEERRVYLMVQEAWWKVDGRGIGVGVVLGVDMMLKKDLGFPFVGRVRSVFCAVKTHQSECLC